MVSPPSDDPGPPDSNIPRGGAQPLSSDGDYRSFYERDRFESYGHNNHSARPEDHPYYAQLRQFIEHYNLADKRCLEIGSGGGLLQDVVHDYSGTDVAENLRRYYRKPYRVTEGGSYPFPDQTFDAIWTIHTYEHIPDLRKALIEIRRLIRPGGAVFFAPAWQCRPWAADGFAVRSYREFGLKGKLIKGLIPLRDSIVWRSLFIFPKRAVRHLAFALGRRYHHILYRRLDANYKVFWTSDSDACNSIDPHDAILWFLSNGFTCSSHASHLRAFFVRTGPLVFRRSLDRSDETVK